jgi:hypothetical protein
LQKKVDYIVGQLLSCVEEVWAHTAVVDGRVMLGEVFSTIVCPGLPEDKDFSLAGPLLDPVETHVDGLGSLLFDGVLGESHGSGVINQWWHLRMTHIFERCLNGDGFLAVHVGGCNFCFGS